MGNNSKATAREKDLKREMGELLKEIRLASGATRGAITQHYVMKELGFSPSMIGKIETGVNFPSPLTIKLLVGLDVKKGVRVSHGLYTATIEELKKIQKYYDDITKERRNSREYRKRFGRVGGV